MARAKRAGPEAAAVERLGARLESARGRIDELESALHVERQRRDELIVDGIDQGVSWSAVAHLAGVSEATVHRVLARD